MEFLIFLAIVGVIFWLMNRSPRGPKPSNRSKPNRPNSPKIRPNTSQAIGPWTSPRPFNPSTSKPLGVARHIKGSAYVIDGDSIIINKTQIRLYGVDAPEMNHPYGIKAKWELVALCKGQIIHAEVTEIDDHGRTVAKCRLPDGRDLSAEMVKMGLAIDWPKYSGGKYKSLEVDDARRKMWLADARQKGRMHVWDQFDARKKRER